MLIVGWYSQGRIDIASRLGDVAIPEIGKRSIEPMEGSVGGDLDRSGEVLDSTVDVVEGVSHSPATVEVIGVEYIAVDGTIVGDFRFLTPPEVFE